jgi:hypothetical protein
MTWNSFVSTASAISIMQHWLHEKAIFSQFCSLHPDTKIAKQGTIYQFDFPYIGLFLCWTIGLYYCDILFNMHALMFILCYILLHILYLNFHYMLICSPYSTFRWINTKKLPSMWLLLIVLQLKVHRHRMQTWIPVSVCPCVDIFPMLHMLHMFHFICCIQVLLVPFKPTN